MGKDIAFGEIPLLLEGRERLQKGHNHGQKSRDTFAFLGRFPIHTGPTPPPPPSPHTPQTKLDACIHYFFFIGWGEKNCKKISKKMHFFMRGPRNDRKI